ncbi:hypothetical protein Anas_13817 [Armadillidium nasatum]|uniref:Uncharacterized protein n=1 Tax=Armadillidium nasatum TaxID=96803 RepID=A0A5N5TB85_9CRUS|nr:hypothetical protein Anas_13817 [Armadillidium nasatum]
MGKRKSSVSKGHLKDPPTNKDPLGSYVFGSEVKKYDWLIERYKRYLQREGRSLSDLQKLKETLPFPLPEKYETEKEIRARMKREREAVEQENLRRLNKLEIEHKELEFMIELNKKEYKKYAKTGYKVGRFRPPKGDKSRRIFMCPVYTCLGIFQKIRRHAEVVHGLDKVKNEKELQMFISQTQKFNKRRIDDVLMPANEEKVKRVRKSAKKTSKSSPKKATYLQNDRFVYKCPTCNVLTTRASQHVKRTHKELGELEKVKLVSTILKNKCGRRNIQHKIKT